MIQALQSAKRNYCFQNLEGWLRVVGRRIISRKHKDSARKYHVSLPIPLSSELDTAPSLLQREESLAALRRAYPRLSLTDQHLLDCYYFQGKRTAELASELYVSTNVVKKRLQRIRKRLRKLMYDD
jgi:RNA polymerase sigma factor (sigma-70 family)